MNILNRAGLAALALSACAIAAQAEPMKLEGTITDVIGFRLVVDGQNGKAIVNLGRKAKDQSALKSGDKVTIEGDMKSGDELKADRITLSDGRTFETAKKQSWYEWLTGTKKAAAGPFTAAAAKTIATGQGYALTADPVSKKKHYTAAATKDGKSFDIDIHKDGSVKAKPSFAMADVKKLAVDKGYTLTTEPKQDKKHFVAMATKNGKPMQIAVHRDGSIKETLPFEAADATKAVKDNGYEVVGEPKQERKHFAVLGKKEGKYYEIHARRNGKVKQIRPVDKTDLTWGPMIQ